MKSTTSSLQVGVQTFKQRPSFSKGSGSSWLTSGCWYSFFPTPSAFRQDAANFPAGRKPATMSMLALRGAENVVDFRWFCFKYGHGPMLQFC